VIWDMDLAREVFPLLLDGLTYTVLATVFGSVLAYVLGLVFAVLRMSPSKLVGTITYWIVEFIRTTPLIVQLYVLFFVLPPLIGFTEPPDPLTVGVIGLGLHYAAYTSEVYRAGIQGVAPGQWEAARALSLPGRRTWFGVILPQAIPKVLPSLGNYTIAMFKETPLLIVIGFTEMLFQANAFGAANFRSVEAYTLTGLLFLVLSIASALLVQLMERYLGRQRA
jgi:polar amino acid transport system permease protein